VLDIPAIIEGYFNVLIENPDVEEIAARRRAICAECPYIGAVKCIKCGCNLNAKTHSLQTNCPDGRWKAEI
jgi:hypothetical protein